MDACNLPFLSYDGGGRSSVFVRSIGFGGQVWLMD